MEQNLPKRSQVAEELTWRLTDIYPDKAAWQADLKNAAETADRLASCAGTLAENAESFRTAMDLYNSCLQSIYRAEVYASMLHDQDTADSEGQAMNQSARTAAVRISETLAFLEPEILEIPYDRIETYYNELPELREYEVTLKEMFRQKEHSLSAELEKLMAASGEMASVPSNAYGMLSNADLKFPSVTDPEGNTVQITNGRFVPMQMNPDRAFRKEVFEKFYERYAEFKNTWAALYDGQVRQQIFSARARKYASTFEAAVDGNNVSPAVCDNLIESVHRNLSPMHRYVRLRRRLLGVDELHLYDVHAPMVRDYERKVTYEEAKEMALAALEPLGEEYISLLKTGFEERWIDVVENEGKRSGAYSTGVYGVHPYVLLNFNGTLDDVFTLVHEMGHSLHTHYSDTNQNFLNSQYRIFVAEVASTTNEILLLEYLLKNAKSKAEEAYLINHYLENFKGTLYRQTMFEEFERKSNEMAEAGIPLTADALCSLYLDLNRTYFGEDMVCDDLISYEWCRIPHFYYNFYVYQYATSFSASVAIAHRILAQEPSAVESYLEFLKSGCTQDPVSLLKIAGVDLSTGTPVDEALQVFAQQVERMETLYAE